MPVGYVQSGAKISLKPDSTCSYHLAYIMLTQDQKVYMYLLTETLAGACK